MSRPQPPRGPEVVYGSRIATAPGHRDLIAPGLADDCHLGRRGADSRSMSSQTARLENLDNQSGRARSSRSAGRCARAAAVTGNLHPEPSPEMTQMSEPGRRWAVRCRLLEMSRTCRKWSTQFNQLVSAKPEAAKSIARKTDPGATRPMVQAEIQRSKRGQTGERSRRQDRQEVVLQDRNSRADNTPSGNSSKWLPSSCSCAGLGQSIVAGIPSAADSLPLQHGRETQVPPRSQGHGTLLSLTFRRGGHLVAHRHPDPRRFRGATQPTAVSFRGWAAGRRLSYSSRRSAQLGESLGRKCGKPVILQFKFREVPQAGKDSRGQTSPLQVSRPENTPAGSSQFVRRDNTARLESPAKMPPPKRWRLRLTRPENGAASGGCYRRTPET